MKIELSIEEIEYIKQSVALVMEHKLGDKDDPKQVKLGESIHKKMLDAKSELKP